MASKDFIMRQIESLEDLFKKLFSKIFNIQNGVISAEGVAEINELLKQITGLDLNEIANSNDEDFLKSLIEKKLSASDMSNLIASLIDLGNVTNNDTLDFDATDLARKAICIDAFMMKSQKTVKYGNAKSIEQAKKLINQKK